MKKNRVLIASGALVACILLVQSCGGGVPTPTPTPPVPSVANAILTLPASISGTPVVATRTSPPVNFSAAVSAIFNPVRETFNPLAETALSYVDGLLKQLQSDVFDNVTIMASLESTGSYVAVVSATEQWDISKVVEGTYKAINWVDVSGTWEQRLNLSVTTSDTRNFGTVYVTDPTVAGGPTYKADFDSADPNIVSGSTYPSVHLWVTGLTSATTTNVVTNIALQAVKSDTYFYAAANVYYTNAAPSVDSSLEPYVMTILNGNIAPTGTVNANYVYRCKVRLSDDVAAIDLAAVPAASNDTSTIFTDYSIASLYKQAVTNYLNDSANSGVLTNLNTLLTDASLTPITTGGTATVTEVISAIDLLYSDTPVAILDPIIVATKLSNPAYFTSTGFAGTDLVGTAYADIGSFVTGFDPETSAATAALVVSMPTETAPAALR